MPGVMWVGHSCPTPLTLVLLFNRPGASPEDLPNLSQIQKRRTRVSDPHTSHSTSIFSPISFLSFSSIPVSSNELVSTALPFSTLVMT